MVSRRDQGRQPPIARWQLAVCSAAQPERMQCRWTAHGQAQAVVGTPSSLEQEILQLRLAKKHRMEEALRLRLWPLLAQTYCGCHVMHALQDSPQLKVLKSSLLTPE